MKRRSFLKKSGALSALTLVTPFGIFEHGKTVADPGELADAFAEPPDSAKPHTWWHWMNGNVTKEGITLDLEAMKRQGIGGFQNFDAGTGIPKGPVVYLSEEWLDLKKHAIKEAERLGLEFTMHNCPGWSSSGGPWITPELSMQEVCWSEVPVEGGKLIDLQLPTPLSRLKFYKDIAAIAYPSLPGEKLHTLLRRVTSSSGEIALNDFASKPFTVSPTAGEAFLLMEFSRPVELSALSFISSVTDKGSPALTLNGSDDGASFTDVATLVSGGGFGGGDFSQDAFITADLPGAKAKFFRLSFQSQRRFSQVTMSSAPRIPDWKKRANFSYNGRGLKPMGEFDSTQVIDPDTIVDVSSFVDASGRLKWNVPAGSWTILRLGHTSLATMNRSAPDTGVGLECDKFSGAAFEFHFNNMMQQLLPSLRSLGAKGKVGMLIDSYEVGMQNWTSGFDVEFEKRNKYPLRKFLPAIIGKVVGDGQLTERFLWDFRKMQGDLMADNYYGKFTELCHKNNIVTYIQPYDRGPMEEMQIGSRIDINVAEFWNNLSSIFQNNWTMRRTTKLAASIAHTNGQRIVAAESYTGEPESAKWQEHPFNLKALGDKMFTHGLNRITFHRFAHQPHPTAQPGMTMGPWGIHFDRTNTWWEKSGPWLKYVARCQHLLQEGKFVADLLYYVGEDAGVYTKVSRDELTPRPPEGFDYDLVNAEVLLKAKVVNRQIVLPSEMQYKILILSGEQTMSLAVVEKIGQLIDAGAIVIGEKPLGVLGLKTYNEKTDAKFEEVVHRLWPGKVRGGSALGSVLVENNLTKAFSYTSKSGDAPILWIQREIGDRTTFFLSNQRRTTEELVCTFRVKGKTPEKWNPVDGTISPVPFFDHKDEETIVSLELGPLESTFIVFSEVKAKPLMSIASGLVLINHLHSYTNSTGRHEESRSLQDTFSITFWAKPESGIMLSTRNFMEGLEPWTDNYAIYPAAGTNHFGQGHSTCGVTVGRNGIALWHHQRTRPILAFAPPGKISGWSHIVISYSQGRPTIFVNGKLFGKSENFFQHIHPPLEKVKIEEGASYFNGDMTSPEILSQALTEDQAVNLMTRGRPPVEERGAVHISGRSLLFFKSGQYVLTFRDSTTKKIDVEGIGEEITLNDNWTVQFSQGQGAPPSVQMPLLKSLRLHEDDGVKYFSGTCKYARRFSLPPNLVGKKKRIQLDLGEVEVIASVLVNGKSLGTFWTRPFVIDITDHVKSGSNDLQIEVTNLWPNRLIGDEQFPEENRYAPVAGFGALSTGAILELPQWYKDGKPKPAGPRVAFATWKHYHKDSPLLESGLIGPVVLRSAFEYLL